MSVTTSLSPPCTLALMASLLNQLSLAFLLFLASSSLQIHARESRFLMRAARLEDPKEATRIPEETPAVKMEEPSNLPPVRSLSGSGYGLYGREQFTPTTTANYNNDNYNYYNNNARPNANTFPSGFPSAELTSENYENKGGYNYGNQFNNANNNPSKFPTEEFNSRSYETKEFTTNNNNYYVDNEKHGLSDTRFLENGKYYFDVKAERNRNQYETYPTRGNPNNANNNPSKFPTEEFNSRSYETKEFTTTTTNNNNNNKNNNYVDNEKHGLSDTRFLENGKYYFDVKAERNRNQYETYPTRGNPEAGARVGNYGNGVYGNANAYQYNNAMGYQNNYQGNQESQENYDP